MAPSRFSGGRERSFVPSAFTVPRIASSACTCERVSRKGLASPVSIPTDTASTSTSSACTRPVDCARMPWSVRLMDVPEMDVAAVRSMPVVPPVMAPPRILASGLAERTPVPVRPSARRSCRTIRVVPAAATTPSCPPEIVRSLAVTPSAPRSTRSAVRESRTATPCSATSLPSSAIPATEAPWIVDACMVRPSVVFSTTTPRRPPVTVSWSSITFALLMWVNTPAGSSAAVSAEIVTSRDRVSSRPPLPSAEVLTAVTCMPVWLSRPIPKPPLPVVPMPVIGRSVLAPVTCTPYAPLCSARTPVIVVPRSPRRTSPVPAEPLTVTPSRCTLWEPSSWSPVPLRSSDVRTSDPVLPVWKSRPGWYSTSACSRPSRGAVPRSLSVASVAVNRPPGETRTNGRPGPGAIAWPEARSTEVTVTPCRVRPPLPV